MYGNHLRLHSGVLWAHIKIGDQGTTYEASYTHSLLENRAIRNWVFLTLRSLNLGLRVGSWFRNKVVITNHRWGRAWSYTLNYAGCVSPIPMPAADTDPIRIKRGRPKNLRVYRRSSKDLKNNHDKLTMSGCGNIKAWHEHHYPVACDTGSWKICPGGPLEV